MVSDIIVVPATFPRPGTWPKSTKEIQAWTVYHFCGGTMPYKDPLKDKEYHSEYYKSRAEKKKEWQRQYRITHREERAASLKNWYQRHKEEQQDRAKKAQRELRLKVIMHYGGRCAFCGDSNINHLSIDHINNDGAEHRRKLFGEGRSASGSKMYRWLASNNFPEGFQVLCHTHNSEKGFYGTMTPMEFDND